jgi:DNA-directed RNA polymerase
MQEFTGREYLQIAIANHFGMDKFAWASRLEWTRDNEANLESLDSDADEPTGYRKAVRAWRDVQAGKPTNYIMGLDATASGIQILAVLAGCMQSAATCNVVNTGRRENVYTYLHDHMTNLGATAEYLLVKDTTVRTCYDSTRAAKDAFGEGTPELLAFYAALKEVVPGAWRAKTLMSNCKDPTATYYTWTLPDDHVAYVPITKTVDKNFEHDELDHLRMKFKMKLQMADPGNRSLPANITHSVDAWVCRQMVLRCHQAGFWMAPVHDCFYASPKYMNEVRRFYNEILTELAQMDLLQSIVREVTGRKYTVLKVSNTLHHHILDADYALS